MIDDNRIDRPWRDGGLIGYEICQMLMDDRRFTRNKYKGRYTGQRKDR